MKKTKPKTITETGWAVWNVLTESQQSRGCRTRGLAWEAFFTVYPFFVIDKNNLRYRGYRCLRTTAKGEL